MDINLKNIDTRNPVDLYKELEKLIKFKDYHAVVKKEDNFYVGGLTIKDLKKASVSQEDILKLHTGLKERNISYAIQESDVNAEYIPLILNDHTRSFFNKHLKGILNTENLKWRIFYIPFEIIDNTIYLKNTELLTDNSEEYKNMPYALKYEDIDVKLKEIISLDSKGKELPKENEVKSDYNGVLDGELFDNNSIKEDELLDEEDSVQEVKEDVEKEEADTYKMVNESDEKLSSENEIQEDQEGKRNVELDAILDKEDTKIPPEIESFLDDLYLGRFNEYESVDQEDTTHILMQKEIKNANDTIAVREQNIKRKAKELFFRYMEQSVKKINEVIDAENGDELIRNKYAESNIEKDKLTHVLEENIEIHKKELEKNFWGKHYEAYKEKTLAGLKTQFEKEEYYNLVSEPLERFISSESNRLDERKDRIEYETDKWIENIKKSALESDRDNAVVEVEEYINKAVKNCQKEISDLERKLQEHNERFLKHEYTKRAEENLRNTVGSDLYTDEEAKRYKKRFEEAQEEKRELSRELEELQDKYINDFENIKQERDNIKKEIDENHKQLLSQKEAELSEIKMKAAELEDEKESNRKQLENSNKKTKKKLLGTSLASLVVVIALGGTTIGSHNNNKEIQDKLDTQTKILQKKNDEVKKSEMEIKKMKDNEDKKNKVIAQQKKELDKNKEKKDSKKKEKNSKK